MKILQKTKLIPGLNEKPYDKRLTAIKVPSMSCCRVWCDMMEVSKIARGDNQSPCNFFTINESRTIGHNVL